MEQKFFRLEDNEIFTIIGGIPDLSKMKNLDFSVLTEVIRHIMGLDLEKSVAGKIIVPEWKEKIRFNKLSEETSRLLEHGTIHHGALMTYLKNEIHFFSGVLRDRLNAIYVQEKKDASGDALFWNIVNKASPQKNQGCQTAVIVIMAKYFETCDIFEAPKVKESKGSEPA